MNARDVLLRSCKDAVRLNVCARAARVCCCPGWCCCRSVQQATAISLAQLAPTGPELKSIFVEKPGLDVLLDLVTDETATASEWCIDILEYIDSFISGYQCTLTRQQQQVSGVRTVGALVGRASFCQGCSVRGAVSDTVAARDKVPAAVGTIAGVALQTRLARLVLQRGPLCSCVRRGLCFLLHL